MNNLVIFNESDNTYTFECPYCNEMIQVSKDHTNCLIFRHGVLKENFTQIDPHLPKTECDRLVELNLIYGCGKPFKLVRNSENIIDRVEVCDYI
tara:strand:+ start:961 stop:1242 length:282 start_codon:yes stop_codon:yes gene_type:complete